MTNRWVEGEEAEMESGMRGATTNKVGGGACRGNGLVHPELRFTDDCAGPWRLAYGREMLGKPPHQTGHASPLLQSFGLNKLF